jgi:branched-chain amino acid transport system ATP-binding protein
VGHGARDFAASAEMNVLRVDRLCKSFGSLNVTDQVSLAIGEGERHVIIGPNGAGKTSLINQISGQIQPDSGLILLQDRDITGCSPDRISRMGVARTFQRNNLFQNLSVMDNLRLALQIRHGTPLNFFLPAAGSAALSERAASLLAKVHLPIEDTRLARQLSYGEQRQLELALALASEPALLLLDEPTSGMSPSETAQIIALISALPRALAILMIEHDMEVVFSIADRITVLYFGKVLATGTPQEIQTNDRVREVYLGLSR